jgi:hypothetical protein
MMTETPVNEIHIPEAFANRMFFTDKEVGEIAGKTSVTIGRWRREGYIKGSYFGKRSVMIARSEVERFIRGEIDFSKPPKKPRK